MPAKRDRPLLEAFLQNAEAASDLLTDNEAIRAIPVIGTAFKVCRGIDDIKSRIFAAKVAAFISEPHLQTAAARQKMKQKLLDNPVEAEAVGETLFLVLDRLIDIDKSALLAKIYVAYIDGVLAQIELKRIAQAIDLSFGEDLKWLVETDDAQLYTDSGEVLALLEPAGLVSSTVGRAPPGFQRLSRSITPLGHALRKAWRHVPTEP